MVSVFLRFNQARPTNIPTAKWPKYAGNCVAMRCRIFDSGGFHGAPIVICSATSASMSCSASQRQAMAVPKSAIAVGHGARAKSGATSGSRRYHCASSASVHKAPFNPREALVMGVV